MILKLRTARIIKDSPSAVLNAPVYSAGTSLGVFSNTGFIGTDLFVMIGNPGMLMTEIVAFTSITGGDIITVGAMKYDHPQGTPVYLIQADKVAFSRAASLNDVYAYIPSGTIATDAVDIFADKEFTTYDDLVNTTGFGKAIFYNSASAATYGSTFEIIRYDQTENKTRGFVKQLALDEMNASIDGFVITEDYLNRQVVQCDTRLRDEKLNWKEDTNELIIPTVLGQTKYDLTTYIKEPKNISSLQFAKILNQDITIVEYDVFLEATGKAINTTVLTQIELVDTTIALADTSDFAAEGTVIIGVDTISYTSKDDALNTLIGCTNITVVHLVNEEVWQNCATGKPTIATVFNGQLRTYPIITNAVDRYNIVLVYNKQYTQITLDSDELAFPFYLYVSYLKVKLGEKTGEKDLVMLKQDFERDLIKHKVKDFSATEHRFTPDKRMVLYPSSRRNRLQK